MTDQETIALSKPASPPSFGTFLSFDDFRGLATGDGPGSPKDFQETMRTRVEPALKGFLEARDAAGLLSRISGSEGHRTPLLSAWNAMVGKEPYYVEHAEWAWRSITGDLGMAFVGKPAIEAEFMAESRGEDMETALRKAYGVVVDRVDAGTVRAFDMDTQACSVTDERYRVRIDGWVPTFVRMGPGRNETPMVPVERPAVIELEVAFETGDLIVADWIRIKEFHDAVEAGVDDLASLNSVAGREALARHYADLGFVSVHVGNSSPRVFERDGVLVLGRQSDGDADDMPSLGSICTDYWGATLIDRGRLVAILADTLGNEAAEAKVEAYLSESDDLRIKVEPGPRWIYMSGDRGLDGKFAPEGLDLDDLSVKFVVSDRPLSMEPAPAGIAP